MPSGDGSSDDLDDVIGAAYPGLLMYARLLTGDPGRAEDAVQEALVRCLRRHRRVAIHEFLPYARRAVANEVIRAAGRWRRETPVADLRVAHPQDTVIEQEYLRSWLGRLPARQRVAIVSRYYLDMSEQDTADLLGCSVSAVKSLCHRGIALLRGGIDDVDIQEPTGRAHARHGTGRS